MSELNYWKTKLQAGGISRREFVGRAAALGASTAMISSLLASAGAIAAEIDHDVLAHAAHAIDPRAFQRARNLLRRRLQQIALVADPHRLDDVAGNLPVQTARRGLDLGKLGHLFSLRQPRPVPRKVYPISQ